MSKCKKLNRYESGSVRQLVECPAERYETALSECPEAVTYQINDEKQVHSSEITHLKVCTYILVRLDNNSYRKEHTENLGNNI